MNAITTGTRRQTETGMTLIELLVAIGITLIIIPVLLSTIQSLYRNHAQTLARALVLSSTTDGVKEVVRDVRGAVYSEQGSLPLVTIGTSTLTLYTDTDYDGRVERVRYVLSGTTLEKRVIEPTATSSYPTASESTSILTRNVTNNADGVPVFRYYTSTSTEITTQARILDVRRVEVTIHAEARSSREVGTIILTSSASIRNLKDTY